MTRKTLPEPQRNRLSDSEIDASLTPHSDIEEVKDSHAARLTVVCCTIAVLGALVWAGLVEVEEKVSGTGVIAPEGQIERIEHQDGGVVLSLVAEENAVLDPGSVLMTFDTEQVAREARKIAGQIDILEAEVIRLRDLLTSDEMILPDRNTPTDAASKAFWAEQVLLFAQIERIQAEAARLDAQKQSAVSRTEIIRSERRIVERQIARYSNHVSNGTGRLIDRERLERDYYQLTQALEELLGRSDELDAARIEKGRRSDELLAQRKRDAAVRWREIEDELTKLRHAAATAEARIERAVVRTSVGGQVQRLEVRLPNELVAPGDLIAEIVPPGYRFRAVVNVSADKIGTIQPGMGVDLKVTSFDFTRFGSISATVTEVSPTSFENASGDVVYRVEIDITDALREQDLEIAIRPGMTVTADILTNKRSVLRYLLDPVQRIQKQSLSET